MESIIIEDKKACLNEPDYGFGEIKSSFAYKKKENGVKGDGLISGIIEEFEVISGKYEEHLESMESFKKMWIQQS